MVVDDIDDHFVLKMVAVGESCYVEFSRVRILTLLLLLRIYWDQLWLDYCDIDILVDVLMVTTYNGGISTPDYILVGIVDVCVYQPYGLLSNFWRYNSHN